MTARLRLGPLPKADTVTLTITRSAALKADLDRYAELHGQHWGGSPDIRRLVPHMLEAFLASDPGYRAGRRATRPQAPEKRDPSRHGRERQHG